MLRHPEYIAEHIAKPIGVVLLEKVGFTDRQRVNEALVDLQIILLGQRGIAPRRQIAVGRAERPIYVCM